MFMEKQLKELESLKEENRKLREENQLLLDIIAQMKTTLNRLICRYVVGRQDQPELAGQSEARG